MKTIDSVLDIDDKKYLTDSLALCVKLEKHISHFYILARIHKKPWKPCSINSYSGSTLYRLRKWLDTLLHPIAKRLPYYTKGSFLLRDQVLNESIDPTSDCWFAVDTRTMYDDIEASRTTIVLKILRNQ